VKLAILRKHPIVSVSTKANERMWRVFKNDIDKVVTGYVTEMQKAAYDQGRKMNPRVRESAKQLSFTILGNVINQAGDILPLLVVVSVFEQANESLNLPDSARIYILDIDEARNLKGSSELYGEVLNEADRLIAAFGSHNGLYQ